jgi:hypothetical protein
MTVPDWLQTRDGGIRRGLNDATWLVLLNETPHYKLVAAPASGQFTCVVTQTNNGKRLDNGIKYASSDAALRGGLQELKTRLGW